MIPVSDLRKGIKVKYEGKLYHVTSAEHVKPGKGTAFVRCKLKDMDSGSVIDRTFRVGEKIEHAFIEKRVAQYLYDAGDSFVFMDSETYEQVNIPTDDLGDDKNYLTANLEVDLLFHEGNVVGIELPNFVIVDISETEPGFKGDTVGGTTKPAKIETGGEIQVPTFVNQGDRVKVDTRTGTYVERA